MLLYELDNFVKLDERDAMVKNMELDREAREFIGNLSRSLKENSSRISPVELARYVGIAFDRTFNGARKGDKMANAIARGLAVREKMAVDEGGSMSADETARLLRMTKQSVLNLYHAGKLLGWRTEKQGAVRFPVWQFVENGRLPGLEATLARLSKGNVLDDWGKVGFFLQKHSLLDDRRPLDLLRENKGDSVLRAAEAYAG